MLRDKIATLFSGVELTLRSFSLALTVLKQLLFRPTPLAGVAAEPAMPPCVATDEARVAGTRRSSDSLRGSE